MFVRPRKIFLSLRKILKIVFANQKCMHFNIFFSFFYVINTYYVILGVIFALCLAQNFKTEVLTVQKKPTFRMSGPRKKIYF